MPSFRCTLLTEAGVASRAGGRWARGRLRGTCFTLSLNRRHLLRRVRPPASSLSQTENTHIKNAVNQQHVLLSGITNLKPQT